MEPRSQTSRPPHHSRSLSSLKKEPLASSASTGSEKALRRIWQQEGLCKRNDASIGPKTTYCQTAGRLFEQIDIDTKDLDDIPELWPQIRRFRLPLVQYTAREVVSGLHFMAYAQQRSLSDARRFVGWLLEHLQAAGPLSPALAFKPTTAVSSSAVGRPNPTVPSRCVQAAGLRHQTIPPGAHGRPTSKPTASRMSSIRWLSPISSTRPPPTTSGSIPSPAY